MDHIYGHGGGLVKLTACEAQSAPDDPHAALTITERATADSKSRHTETMHILRTSLANRRQSRGYRINPYRS